MSGTLSSIIISSYHTGDSSGAKVPIDSISINYGKVKVRDECLNVQIFLRWLMSVRNSNSGGMTTTGCARTVRSMTMLPMTSQSSG